MSHPAGATNSGLPTVSGQSGGQNQTGGQPPNSAVPAVQAPAGGDDGVPGGPDTGPSAEELEAAALQAGLPPLPTQAELEVQYRFRNRPQQLTRRTGGALAYSRLSSESPMLYTHIPNSWYEHIEDEEQSNFDEPETQSEQDSEEQGAEDSNEEEAGNDHDDAEDPQSDSGNDANSEGSV